ncbi:hypothetical protein F8568_038000 [Actinomadura sp. LD22]|uniref:PPE domain-containing protein n=1 Tax=Actinomadura physcomitrii TaxID=2650748 RepID=A0A6I4MIM4_9ACTN|nr:hypothetical protein [Actinomadura physcomitrii]MWA06048.1 hypothetical protein [Actinomadura physcomitrii]
MTNEYTYYMRDGAPTGSPGRYDRASILQYLKSSDPGAVTEAGEAYLRFAAAYEKLTPKLAQIGHDLNDAWNGTDAAAAQEQLRNLWASSRTIGAASRDFGTAIERHGSEYLAWYKNNMPQPKNDAEARSWMQGANERITETWSAFPSSISTSLSSSNLEHGGLISTTPAGGSVGPGAPGGVGGPDGAGEFNGSTTLNAAPSSASSGSESRGGNLPGNLTPTPLAKSPGGGPETPIAPPIPPGQHGAPPVGFSPTSPGSGNQANQGTDLSGVPSPGMIGDSSPALPDDPKVPLSNPGSGSANPVSSGLPPHVPNGAGFVPGPGSAGLPGGAVLGLPRSANGAKGGGTPEIGDLNRNGPSGNGRIRNGVIGRGSIGPGAATAAATFREATAARSGPMAMGPMVGAGGSTSGDRERHRQAWADEDSNLWNEDIEAVPGVLGAAPRRPTRDGGPAS